MTQKHAAEQITTVNRNKNGTVAFRYMQWYHIDISINICQPSSVCMRVCIPAWNSHNSCERAKTKMICIGLVHIKPTKHLAIQLGTDMVRYTHGHRAIDIFSPTRKRTRKLNG